MQLFLHISTFCTREKRNRKLTELNKDKEKTLRAVYSQPFLHRDTLGQQYHYLAAPLDAKKTSKSQ